MSQPTTPDLSTLTDDGDFIDLPDGKRITLLIRPDEYAGDWNDQMDAECFGTVEWTSVHDGDFGAPRPRGFDGSARKIITDYPMVCWWQPPTAKVIGTVWTTEQWREQTAYVIERVTYGWSQVGVRVSEVITDSIGQEHRVTLDTAWCGGVDECYPELVEDQYHEVMHMVSEAVAA